MGAPALLQGLRRAGFTLSVLPSGELTVKPASKLTDSQRATIKVHKADIVATLQAPPPAFDSQALEERAGIIEHDGGLSREQAEALAAGACGEPPDPDRHCWPHTTAMSTGEIERFTERVALFMRRGVHPVEAETLADRLVGRDRDGDDRRLCLECMGLDAKGRCAPARRGYIEGSACVLEQVADVLHRCEGFGDLGHVTRKDANR